jgi:AraC-like DNA-binding protein
MNGPALRNAFLAAIPPELSFHLLFNHLPGVLFFAKDREGRLLAANRALFDLAKKCGLSVRQFERKFKEHLKTPPQQYLIKMRVHAACDELRRSKKSIADIATDLGLTLCGLLLTIARAFAEAAP